MKQDRRNFIGAALAAACVPASATQASAGAPSAPVGGAFLLAAPVKVAMPVLPYARNALEPVISAETLDFHFGRHHVGYFTRLRDLLGPKHAELDLVQVTLAAHKDMSGPKDAKSAAALDVYNAAGQIWNHNFYWDGLRAGAAQQPSPALAKALTSSFGSVDGFYAAAHKGAMSVFGSGWLWLAMDRDGRLSLVPTINADSPLTMGLRPLWVIDVWEHAYYIDHRSARSAHVTAVLKNLVNWDFVQRNYTLA